LVQLSSFSFGADQSGLKQIDFAATIHLTSDQFEASDPPAVCPFDQGKVIAARTAAATALRRIIRWN
jgi:hypothetical protein